MEKTGVKKNIDLQSVLIQPRITEKASGNSENGVYVFNVNVRATKKTIMGAMKEIYGVDPIKVNIVSIPAKRVFIRGKWGKKSGGKKAYIFLKKGETKEIDVNGDGVNDLSIELVSIDDVQAEIDVKKLEGAEAVEVVEEEEKVITPPPAAPSRAGLWITILVILLVIGIGYYLITRKKNK